MYTYKKLNADEFSMVLEMNESFRSGFIDEREAQRFLSDERNWLFAAVDDDHIIGFAYGYELKRLDRSEPMLYIHEVGVKENYQRQGDRIQNDESHAGRMPCKGYLQMFPYNISE